MVNGSEGEATPHGEASARSEWLIELEQDGHRSLAIKTVGKVQLHSRNDMDSAARYSSFAALSPMPDETVLRGDGARHGGYLS